MKSAFYKVLWILVHRLFDLFEVIFIFGLECHEKLINFIINIPKSRRTDSFCDDQKIIEHSLNEMKKIPKHLAVILYLDDTSDGDDLIQLSKLVLWSLRSGVSFISFYDYKGVLKNELSSAFRKSIKQHLSIADNENIVWGPDYHFPSEGNTSDPSNMYFPHRNGYKNHIVVNLYSVDDGYAKFNQLLTQELCVTRTDKELRVKCDSKRITIDYIDEKLGELNGHLPDPDVAIYFGYFRCTSGFMPWQIRLTEFFEISNRLHTITQEKFLKVLYKYAKCEQRFGK